jgi:acetylornithine deacetylase/succinyl-diaminopimelate desuccinylase-like protein
VGEHLTLRADVEALSAMVRDSAGPGERASARWIARRLLEAGAIDVRVEPYRYRTGFALAQTLHAAAGLLATRLPWRLGMPLGLAALVSLELDASGRWQWLARLPPVGEGANVVARIPARGYARASRTIVVLAHHDTARTGVFWKLPLERLGRERRLRRRRIDPFLVPFAPAFLLATVLRRASAAALGAALLAGLDLARGPAVPGASDNASGVAALLALAQRFAREPLAGVDIVLLAPGSEEAGMGGMAAFLGAHPRPDLVLSLDTLGAGIPIVLAAEGSLLAHAYDPSDLDLADRGAARSGQPAPERWRIGGWTDPILARFAGIPAISLLSVGPDGVFTNYHRITDTPERVDWDSVERCVAIAGGIVEEFGALHGAG